MGRKLKLDITGPDRRVTEDEVREKGWNALFAPDLAQPLRLVVEIGFGRGEFLTHLATENPAVSHVGVEYSFVMAIPSVARDVDGYRPCLHQQETGVTPPWPRTRRRGNGYGWDE